MSFSQGTPSSIDWRYTAMKVRVGPFDAMVVFPPLIIFAMSISWWTFGFAVLVIVVMYMAEVFMRMPLKIVLRSMRSSLAGDIRMVVPWWKKNKF